MKKLIIAVVVILTLLPLFKPGLFNVHDPTSILRFYTLRATLTDGQIPASWTNLMNHGAGYPLHLYYAPIFTYFGSLLSFVTPSYLFTLKLSLVVLTLFGALGMYKLAGFLAAVAFTLLPYHASSLYVRGSYAELTTMMLLPWLLYYWQRPLSRQNFFLTSLVTSIFLMSHNSLPFLFLPALLVWIIYYQRGNLKFALLSLISSFSLSAWFLLPVFFERGLVQVDGIAVLSRPEDHALSLSQLWHSNWGYGGSAVGNLDGMSFMLGKFQLVLAILSVAYLLIKRQLNFPKIYFLTVFAVYSFATLDLSLPLWNLFPSLQIVQFPWRNLAFATFALSALISLPKKSIFALRLPLVFFSTILLLYFNLKFFKPEITESYNDSHFLSQEKLDTAARDKIPEYLPATMPDFPNTNPCMPTPSPDCSLHKTPTKVNGLYTQSLLQPLFISVAYMPQWVLTVNGEKADIRPSNSGMVETVKSFPPENYDITLSWHRTLLETIGIVLSLLSLIFMIGYSRGILSRKH